LLCSAWPSLSPFWSSAHGRDGRDDWYNFQFVA
jgi:hypothetical protein